MKRTTTTKNAGGRPPRAGAASTVRIPVPATREERARWKAAHQELGIAMTDTAREAFERVVARAAKTKGSK